MTAAEHIGKYRLLDRIGGGGMGEVYRAQMEGPAGFSKELAIKVIRTDFAANPKFLELFLREGKALSALSHRGIVQVFDLGVEAGCAYLVMERLKGINLAQLLVMEGRPLPWRLVAYVGAEIARALSAAHATVQPDAPSGWVHGDLSPSNVMACSDGAVKLLDFGLARPSGFQSSAPGIRGKLPYLPPEALAGTPPDGQVDIYALGVILYQLLTGELPFDAPNDLAVMNLILHAPIVSPSQKVTDLPLELEACVMRALSKDRSARFAQAESLAHELEQLVAGRFGPSDLARHLRTHVSAREPVSFRGDVGLLDEKSDEKAETKTPVLKSARHQTPGVTVAERPVPAGLRRRFRKAHGWGALAALMVVVCVVALRFMWTSERSPAHAEHVIPPAETAGTHSAASKQLEKAETFAHSTRVRGDENPTVNGAAERPPHDAAAKVEPDTVTGTTLPATRTLGQKTDSPQGAPVSGLKEATGVAESRVKGQTLRSKAVAGSKATRKRTARPPEEGANGLAPGFLADPFGGN